MNPCNFLLSCFVILMLTIQKSFIKGKLTLRSLNISEHGEKPWRSRRCNQGGDLAEGSIAIDPVTSRDHPGGKAVGSLMI